MTDEVKHKDDKGKSLVRCAHCGELRLRSSMKKTKTDDVICVDSQDCFERRRRLEIWERFLREKLSTGQ